MRKRKPGRLADIAEAALVVFTREGYRRAQMADIAVEAGISTGALYSYVESKDALFELALARALGLELSEDRLPVAATGLVASGTPFGHAIDRIAGTPALLEALRPGRRGSPARALRPVLREIFDLVSRHRRLIWLLDRCAPEMTEIRGLREALMRRGRIMAAFEDFVAGFGSAAAPSKASARALFEMIVWMGLHRHRDALAGKIDEAEAFEAVHAIAAAALGVAKKTVRA